MAKYRVYARVVDYYYIDVEAKDKDEAIDMYELIDGSEFHLKPSFVEWNIDEVVCLDNDGDVDFTAEEVLY